MSQATYFFPHIPKTGGALIFRNVEASLPKPQVLRLNYTHKHHYFDPRTQKINYYSGEEDFKTLLHSLSFAQKNVIRFVSGHDLYYGLQESFPRPHKMFIFFREPIARTLSLYNFQRGQYEALSRLKKHNESEKRFFQAAKTYFLEEGKVPSFEMWLERSYDQKQPFHFTAYRFLDHFGYLKGNLFEKFDFVGLTETLNEDSLFLYKKMGVNRFWSDKNRSFPYIRYQELRSPLKDLIQEKNRPDFELYRQAQEANALFKKEKPEFRPIVLQMKRRKFFNYPLEKAIFWLKFFLRPVILPIHAMAVRRGLFFFR